ncbi:MAG: hypothetical protein NTZ63_00035 [Candidatus Omnitrophica bacterium]|nr:hypothetical protein [Candidatus Omnitrophota bacterium]
MASQEFILTLWSKTTYFQQYQKSFKEGEYNFKTPVSTPYGQVIRSYFSGGVDLMGPAMRGVTDAVVNTGKQLPLAIQNDRNFLGVQVTGNGLESPSIQITTEVPASTAQTERAVILNSINSDQPGQLTPQQQRALIHGLSDEQLRPKAEFIITKLAPRQRSALFDLADELDDIDALERLQALLNRIYDAETGRLLEGRKISLVEAVQRVRKGEIEVSSAEFLIALEKELASSNRPGFSEDDIVLLVESLGAKTNKGGRIFRNGAGSLFYVRPLLYNLLISLLERYPDTVSPSVRQEIIDMLRDRLGLRERFGLPKIEQVLSEEQNLRDDLTQDPQLGDISEGAENLVDRAARLIEKYQAPVHEMAAGTQNNPEAYKEGFARGAGESVQAYTQRLLNSKYEIVVKVVDSVEQLQEESRRVGFAGDVGHGFGYNNNGRAEVYVLSGYENNADLMTHEVTEALARQNIGGVAKAGAETGEESLEIDRSIKQPLAVIAKPFELPVVQEAIKRLGINENEVIRQLQDKGVRFVRGPPIEGVKNAVFVDLDKPNRDEVGRQIQNLISTEFWRNIELSSKIATTFGEVDQSFEQEVGAVFAKQAFVNELRNDLPVNIVEKLREVTGDPSLTAADFTGDVQMSLYMTGTNKIIFQVVFAKKQGSTEVAFKRAIYKTGITLEELGDLEFLSGLGFTFIPKLGWWFMDSTERLCYVEEFIPGHTAYELLKSGNLSLEKRREIVSSILKTGKALKSGMPQDVHGKNFIIRDGDQRVFFVDLGTRRVTVSTEAQNSILNNPRQALWLVNTLVGYFGYDLASGEPNDFAFEEIQKNFPQEWQVILNLAYNYGNAILRSRNLDEIADTTNTSKDTDVHKRWIKNREDLAHVMHQLGYFLAKDMGRMNVANPIPIYAQNLSGRIDGRFVQVNDKGKIIVKSKEIADALGLKESDPVVSKVVLAILAHEIAEDEAIVTA